MTYQTSNKLSVANDKLSDKRQEGVTLMLAVLILAAIMAIALSLSAITFVEIRSSGDLLRTEPTFYAADAVAEEALYKVKRNVPDNQLSYSGSLNGVSLDDPSPSESATSTPILQVAVSTSNNSFDNTKNHYLLYNALCPQCSASGYGRLKITYLPTGNTSDVLHAYLCEFDPTKTIDPTGSTSGAYLTLPCSDKTDTQSGYWKVIDNTLISGDTRDTALGSPWPAINPNLQQELILYNTGTHDIYVEIDAYADDGSTPKGLPLVGQTAVDINASSAGVIRKIRTLIPNANPAVSNIHTVTISSGVAAKGTAASLDLNFFSLGNVPATGVQFDVLYNTSDITSVDSVITPGPVMTAASKTGSCNTLSPGHARCLIFGFNTNPLTTGVLGSLTFNVSGGAAAGSTPILFNGSLNGNTAASPLATDASGNSIPLNAVDNTLTISP